MTVSMHGLDLSFLKTKESKAFIRKASYQAKRLREARQFEGQRSELASPVVMNDIKAFVSPVTKEVISSRSTLARHNRANNVRQCGEIDGQKWVDHLDREHKKRTQPQEGISFSWSKPH